MDQNISDEVWVGPYDDAPDCIYNCCVGCYKHDCVECGWNPFVSLYRISTKYGKDAANYLTMQSD